MNFYQRKGSELINCLRKETTLEASNLRRVSILMLLFTVVALLFIPSKLCSAAVMSIVDSEEDKEDSIILTNGQNSVFINGKLIQIGDRGKGWFYKNRDLIQLTGDSSIRSILVTDNLKSSEHLLGSRNFTIEIIGTNTITASTKHNKAVKIEYPDGVYDEFGNYNASSIMIPKDWGITVMGNLKITGHGSLNLVNTSGSSVSEFIYAFGNITIKGPSIIADMKDFDSYGHVMTAYGFSLIDNKQKGLISFAGGMLEIKNAAKGISPLYGYEGLKLGDGVRLIAGKTKSAAVRVTPEQFWNYEDWGVKVGPDPKKYHYINISNRIEAPGKADIISISSLSASKVTINMKKIDEASGYQITYSTNNAFAATTTSTVNSNGLAVTLSNLRKGKTYYIKVRAYKLDSEGKRVYGLISSVKKIVVKK